VGRHNGEEIEGGGKRASASVTTEVQRGEKRGRTGSFGAWARFAEEKKHSFQKNEGGSRELAQGGGGDLFQKPGSEGE